MYRIFDSRIASMPPCGLMWKKRFELRLSCIKMSSFYLFILKIFSNSKAYFFKYIIRPVLKWIGALSTWRAALVRCCGALPGDDSTFLANLFGTARGGNEKPPLQRGNRSLPWQQPKRQEGQWVSLGDLYVEKSSPGWKIL